MVSILGMDTLTPFLGIPVLSLSLCLAGGAREQEKVSPNPEALLLMASSQRDMEDWVQAIRRVIWAPLGGGTARSSHAHPVKPLPTGNHASLPARGPQDSYCRSYGCVSHRCGRQVVVVFIFCLHASLWLCQADPAGQVRALFENIPFSHHGVLFTFAAGLPGSACGWEVVPI